MNNNDSNDSTAAVRKFHLDYEELDSEFQSLISAKNKLNLITSTGALTNAAITVEKLLKFIIHNEGKGSSPEFRAAQYKGYNELKKIVGDKIPPMHEIHINSISKWRNFVAHPNDNVKITVQELITVSSSLKAFVDWFFKDYLKADYIDTTQNKYVDKGIAQANNTQEKENANSDNENKIIETEAVKSTEWIKIVSWLLGSSLIISVLVMTILLIRAKSDKSTALKDTQATSTRTADTSKKAMNKDEVYNFLIIYFNSLNDRNMDAYQFFSETVDQYYLERNLNPLKINIINQANTEYIDKKFALDKESLYLASSNGDNSYWRFWCEFSCYRQSKRLFQNCKVQTEFGINTAKKITSIKEIEVGKLQYSKLKPK